MTHDSEINNIINLLGNQILHDLLEIMTNVITKQFWMQIVQFSRKVLLRNLLDT